MFCYTKSHSVVMYASPTRISLRIVRKETSSKQCNRAEKLRHYGQPLASTLTSQTQRQCDLTQLDSSATPFSATHECRMLVNL